MKKGAPFGTPYKRMLRGGLLYPLYGECFVYDDYFILVVIVESIVLLSEFMVGRFVEGLVSGYFVPFYLDINRIVYAPVCQIRVFHCGIVFRLSRP